MHIRHPKDFLTGIMFILFGAAAMVFAAEYPIGTAAKMGPGYFPFVLGGVLGLLGLVVLARSLLWATGAHGWPTLRVLPVTLVLSSVVLFGLLLRPLGLVGATLVLVLICSRASSEFRWKEAAAERRCADADRVGRLRLLPRIPGPGLAGLAGPDISRNRFSTARLRDSPWTCSRTWRSVFKRPSLP